MSLVLLNSPLAVLYPAAFPSIVAFGKKPTRPPDVELVRSQDRQNEFSLPVDARISTVDPSSLVVEMERKRTTCNSAALT